SILSQHGASTFPGAVQGATSVSFGGSMATSVSCGSTTRCTATTPTGSGTVDTVVTVGNLSSATASADWFTYNSTSASLAVTAVAPPGGPAGGGTQVTIMGTGFNPTSGATTVWFASIQATVISCGSQTCTVTSPPGSGRVDVTVRVGGQTSGITSADQYTYN